MYIIIKLLYKIYNNPAYIKENYTNLSTMTPYIYLYNKYCLTYFLCKYGCTTFLETGI